MVCVVSHTGHVSVSTLLPMKTVVLKQFRHRGTN